VLVSFKTDRALLDPLTLPTADTGTLDHYRNVLYAAGYDFPLFFRNSIVISTLTVLAVLLLAVPASYASIRLRFGGTRLLYAVAGLRLLPAIFFVIPLFVMFSTMGLLDKIWAMVIVDTFLNLPIAIVLLTRAVSYLPIEIEEAARVDGAGEFRVLWNVVVPLLAPTMAATAVVTFLFTWNDYLFAVVMTTSEARTVTVGATNFVTSFGVLWGDVSAVTSLSVLIPVILALFAQKYLVGGLTTGAVK
jgi:multiple sugar transport system permease protein